MSNSKLFKNYALDSKLKSNTNGLFSNHPFSTQQRYMQFRPS